MKRFKIEGWYRYNDEKDFETLVIFADSALDAVDKFYVVNKFILKNYYFYKITVEQFI